MFRKTPSNPGRASLGEELLKQLSGPMQNVSQRLGSQMDRYPRQILIGMIVCMVLSGALAFSVLRFKKTDVAPKKPASARHSGKGIGEILETGNALKEVLTLQSRINAILARDSLTAADSSNIRIALGQLDSIHTKLNSK